MNDKYTHISAILDRSGSMLSVRDDIVGGFNQFIKDQQAIEGKCTLTLVQFDSENPYDVLRQFSDIETVKALGDEYKPRASTPLYDAIGRGIVDTGERLAAMPETERPAKVIFLILTDGQENASREYNRAKVAEMTKHQTDKYNWQFMYLGANQDGMAEGMKAGMSRDLSATYSEEKTCGGILLASQKMSAYRTSNNVADLQFTAADRKSLA